MFATTANRVVSNTPRLINERIRHDVDVRIGYYAHHQDEIGQRLRELDDEWDIERVLETASSALTLAGAVLGISRSRKWWLLSLGVQSFFLQHALQGWCPPLPVLRRLGVRTSDEINRERYALKALRGDFDGSWIRKETGQTAAERRNNLKRL